MKYEGEGLFFLPGERTFSRKKKREIILERERNKRVGKETLSARRQRRKCLL